MICRFIDDHRDRFGVQLGRSAATASVPRSLSTAPGSPERTYYAWRKRAPSKRALSDLVLVEVLADYYQPGADDKRRPESLYGATKMWAHLGREGITVARATVERLMRANGWKGVVRTRRVRTTEADPAATRAPDLVEA
jgi:putative transposase